MFHFSWLEHCDMMSIIYWGVGDLLTDLTWIVGEGHQERWWRTHLKTIICPKNSRNWQEHEQDFFVIIITFPKPEAKQDDDLSSEEPVWAGQQDLALIELAVPTISTNPYCTCTGTNPTLLCEPTGCRGTTEHEHWAQLGQVSGPGLDGQNMNRLWD